MQMNMEKMAAILIPFAAVFFATHGVARAAPPVTAGLVLHLDAAAITGLNDGDRVAQWDDLSGCGNHACQADANRQPVFKQNIVNGLPGLRFDGSPRWLSILNFGIDIRNATVFVVGDSNSDNGIFVSQRLTNGRWYSYRHRYLFGSGGQILFPQSYAGFHVFTGLGSGDNKNAYVDGDHAGSVSNADATQPVRVNIGCGTNSNGTPAVGAGWGELDGDIAEILIYNRALSDEDRDAVERYLGRKWLGWESGAFSMEFF